MSKIALTGNALGSGTLTLAAPNTNTDRTLTLPDEAGTVLTDTGLPAELNATGSAPLYACRAWVNFDGTGTVAIRASGNVSSITDNGTGDYTVNFTTAMPDANYAPAYGGGDNALGGAWDYITGTYQTNAGSLRVRTYARSTGNLVDPTLVSASIFR